MVTLKRNTFNGNKAQVYFMVVEIVVVQLHIFTKATEQFHSSFS